MINKTNREIEAIVSRIQQEINSTNHLALTKQHKNEELINNTIRKYITDHHIVVEGYSSRELMDRVYNAMAGYDLLTPLLDNLEKNIEEININRYDDIKIHYRNGDVVRSKQTFLSPKMARDIMIRLLEDQSEKTLSQSNPIVRGFLGSNVRITASCYPLLDEDAGVQASIRIINPNKLGRDDFIKNDTLTEEMFDFLEMVLSCGTSICVAGATNSGKTTLMSGILSRIPDEKRIITIEEEVREFNLIKRDEEGNVINNVVHWRTHDQYDQNELLTFSLTSNPDVICVAEMKSKEAYAAQEAARTGHAVMTTTHANSCRAAYTRMVTLCKLTSSMDDKVLYSLVTEAFPIAIFCKRLDDYSRKVMEITECMEDETGKIRFNTLYDYEIESSEKVSDTKSIIEGHFVKRGEISRQFQQWLVTNGVPTSEIKRFISERSA